MSKMVVLTTKVTQYPGYDTYTIREFLSLSQDTLRKIDSIYIAEPASDKKLRKVACRAAAFSISIMPILPDEVLDVAESSTVYLQDSNVHVNVHIPSLEDLYELNDTVARDEVLVTLANEVKKLMDTTSYKLGTKMSNDLMSGLSQFFRRLNAYNTEELRQEVMTRAVRQFEAHVRVAKTIRRARDQMMDKEILNTMQVLGRITHKHPFFAGEPRQVKPKSFLKDPVPVTYFKTKQELAEHLLKQVPTLKDVRKRNAFIFNICVEMSEKEVLNLAAHRGLQEEYLAKYR